MNTDTTRRALLKAAPSVAIIASMPATAALAAPITDRGEWNFAMASYEAAKAHSDNYDAAHFFPAWEREQAVEEAHGLVWGQPGFFEQRKALQEQHGYQVPDGVHDEQERLVEVMCDAEHAVWQTPAPDLQALRWKLERVIDAEPEKGHGTSSWAPEYVAQTMADIARLLPEGR